MATKQNATLDPREVLNARMAELQDTQSLLDQRDLLSQQIDQRLTALMPMNHPRDGKVMAALGKLKARTTQMIGKKANSKAANGTARHDGPKIGDLLEKVLVQQKKRMSARELVDAIKDEYKGRAGDPYMVVLNTLKTEHHRFSHRKMPGSRNVTWALKESAQS
jgi:hypothetical protein